MSGPHLCDLMDDCLLHEPDPDDPSQNGIRFAEKLATHPNLQLCIQARGSASKSWRLRETRRGSYIKIGTTLYIWNAPKTITRRGLPKLATRRPRKAW